MVRRGMLLVLILAGCSSPDRETRVGGARPTNLAVPPDVDDARRYPLVLSLHAYGATGLDDRDYLGITAIKNRGDAFVLAPDGIVDDEGKRYWTADTLCCDFDGRRSDDVAYLHSIVEDALALGWPIDPAAIYAVGHGNGGIMAYRLACDDADTFAGIVALAGRAVNVPCDPARPVNVLHVAGDADVEMPFSTAESTVEKWAAFNGCSGEATTGPRIDLDNAVPGVDTDTGSVTGCPAGGAVELWRIHGGGSTPSLTSAWEPALSQWLVDHGR